MVEGVQIPLLLKPKQDHSNTNTINVASLVDILKANKDAFEDMLLKHSAILFRGFDVKDAQEFNDVVEAIGCEDIRYVGPAPRTHVHKRVWTANEGPLSEFIYYHHEMVLIKEFPTKVILFCEVPPPEGGETPFVTSWGVTERMLKEFPENVREMEEKGLRYSFTALSKNDTGSMRGRGWEDAFGTSDKVEAEKRAKALGMDIEWLSNGGVKAMLGPRQLTRVFPNRQNRKMWFNTIVGMYGKETSSAEMADGSKIPSNVVERCGEIIEDESIQFKWEKGDVLFLDNLALLHGRRPSLPPRKVLVATCK
ncbi:clavaminate synthase-like protein At3g21360 [Dioscorea cayenensis subsp. rotundata]|uniref:Clavaminate synthase-like protein At3g21360 n=1 Tax=Dioscorea cayennensis subsp. rotundata TaxID=55577 RepID=A0AB40ANE3_DIOCR|nr:clavaminate synthase-like protein At3g21360 [Dioscorea cayenensis subsp. rotundata]